MSSLQKPHLCTHNIYMFIDCLCMGSHNAGMLPYIHVGHPKSRQLSVLVGRTVIISQHDSASSLQSPTQVPAQQLWLVGTFCSAVGLHLPQCTDLKQNVMYAVQSIKCNCLLEWLLDSLGNMDILQSLTNSADFIPQNYLNLHTPMSQLVVKFKLWIIINKKHI